MNILSRIPSPFSVDGAYLWFQVFSLLFLTATILTGAGTIITGFIANRRTAAALAIQQERAAKAETALKLLESERQPRHLTPEASGRLSKVLRDAADKISSVRKPPDKMTLVVLYEISGDDTKGFSDDIVTAIKAGGFTVDALLPANVAPQGPDTAHGITLESTDSEPTTLEADMLERALIEAGLEVKRVRLRIDPNLLPEGRNPYVRLLIGTRPNPRIERKQ